MSVRRQILLFLTLLVLWLGGGCRGGDSQPVAAEIDEPYYRQGQQQVKQGRTQEALASFLKVIQKRGEQASAESHLEAGLIYLNHSKDPVEAYHHFRQYLAQQPNSRQAPNVRELVDTAKRDFARTLPGQPLENQAPRVDLLEQVRKLQRENEDLRAEMAALRGAVNAPILRTTRGPANPGQSGLRAVIPQAASVVLDEEESPITAAPVQPRPPVLDATTPGAGVSRSGPSSSRTIPLRPGTVPTTSARRHVVVPGDTLFGLSKKYYGASSTAKAKAIFEANRDVMKNEGDLRPGMELRIP